MKKLLAFYILLFLACNEQKPKREYNTFDLDGTVYDFGLVKESDTLRTRFTFKNQLDYDLVIEKISKSGKGLQIHIQDSVLKPNETTEITVVFLPHNLRGNQKRMISLKTNNSEQPYYSYYIEALIKNQKAIQRLRFFDLLRKKKYVSDTLRKKHFDFSKRFTKKEIVALNLDTTKLDLNTYYVLADEKFLKEQTDSVFFLMYYRHTYGDQLEKIVRIKRKDTVFDLTLSMIGGDGLDSYAKSTEFVNDSIFRVTSIESIALADDTYYMVDWIESIVTKYIYNQKLDLKEISKDTFNYRSEVTTNQFTGKREVLTETIRKLGTINQTKMFYGFHNFSSSYTDRISLYKKKGDGLIPLIRFDSGSALLQESKLVWLNQQPFVYFSFSETSGASYGTLYAIDKNISNANTVKYDYGDSEVADSLEVRNGTGPLLDDTNKVSSFSLLISKNSGIRYGLTREFELVKIGDNSFVLKLVQQNIKELEYKKVE
ncbi:MAG: DUF1573 domain-containing protein [Bacteroidota bacterium]